jgi:hypothetical protein
MAKECKYSQLKQLTNNTIMHTTLSVYEVFYYAALFVITGHYLQAMHKRNDFSDSTQQLYKLT